jgi:hypothetical protein
MGYGVTLTVAPGLSPSMSDIGGSGSQPVMI